MPKRVILHVGLHKTGTSALQKMFYAQRHHLAVAGVDYPDSFKETDHNSLCDAIMQGNRPVLQRFLSATHRSDCLFLSSENVGCLTLDQMDVLRRLFPDAQIEIVIVLRRLQDLWPSHWRELIKHGLPHSLGMYLGQLNEMAPVTLSSPLRPAEFLARCEAIFGRDALKIMIYDAHPRGAGYGPAFAKQALGLELGERLGTGTHNLIPVAWKIELGRLFNRIGIGWVNHIERKKIFAALIGKLSFEEPDWMPDFRVLLEDSKPIILSEQSRLVTEELSRIVECYGERIVDPVEVLFAPGRTEVRCLNLEDIPLGLQTEIKKEFRSFRLRVTDARTPEEHEAENLIQTDIVT